MTPKPLASLAVVAVASMALGACTSTTSPPIKQPSAGTASEPTGSSVSTDTVHLTDYAANTDGPTSTVILTGAIGDYGTGTTVHPDGSVDPDHAGELKLALAHGSFRISIAELHTMFADAFTGQFPTDTGTCSGSVTVSAAAPIVAGSGTGAYAHVSGSFNLTLTVDEVDQLPTCDGTGAFLAQTILFTGSGAVALT